MQGEWWCSSTGNHNACNFLPAIKKCHKSASWSCNHFSTSLFPIPAFKPRLGIRAYNFRLFSSRELGLSCMYVQQMEIRLLWYTLLLVLLSSHLLELYCSMCTSVQIVITVCPPCGREYVLGVFYDASSTKMFELDQRNHCFKFLSLNVRKAVMRAKCHSHCHRSSAMTSTVNLCLSMKIFSELSTIFKTMLWVILQHVNSWHYLLYCTFSLCCP